MNKALSTLAIALLLAACSSGDTGITAKITEQFDASSSEPVNLAQVGPPTWERLCVLGPYSMNKTAEQVLGFKWNVEQLSSVGSNDGINLLVFIRNQEVIAFTEHRRDKGDFLQLSPRCLSRAQATLVRRLDGIGWVQLVTK